MMKCPRCGQELRRSQRDPSFGLCDNCRKKFKLIPDEKCADTDEGFGNFEDRDRESRAGAKQNARRRPSPSDIHSSSPYNYGQASDQETSQTTGQKARGTAPFTAEDFPTTDSAATGTAAANSSAHGYGDHGGAGKEEEKGRLPSDCPDRPCDPFSGRGGKGN